MKNFIILWVSLVIQAQVKKNFDGFYSFQIEAHGKQKKRIISVHHERIFNVF